MIENNCHTVVQSDGSLHGTFIIKSIQSLRYTNINIIPNEFDIIAMINHYHNTITNR